MKICNYLKSARNNSIPFFPHYQCLNCKDDTDILELYLKFAKYIIIKNQFNSVLIDMIIKSQTRPSLLFKACNISEFINKQKINFIHRKKMF